MAGKRKDISALFLMKTHLRLALRTISMTEIGRLIEALLLYDEEGTLPEPGRHRKQWDALFEMMAETLDENTKRYKDRCHKNQQTALQREEHKRAQACTTSTKLNQDKLNQDKINLNESNACGGPPPALRGRLKRATEEDDDGINWLN